MKTLLTIILVVTALSAVQGNPVRPPESEDEAEYTFLTTINKLAGHENYQEILDGAKNASKDALKKPNPANLNAEQRKAVYFYTIEEPPFYLYLNQKLRAGQGAGEFGDYVNLLLSALQKIGTSSPNSNTLWRLIRGQRLNHNKGDRITWPAFSSTSSSRELFKNVDTSKSTLYEIQNAKGYHIESYSEFSSEEEFVLTPNTELEVIAGPNAEKPLYTLRLIQLGTATSKSVSPDGAVAISMTVSRATWIIAIIVTYTSVF